MPFAHGAIERRVLILAPARKDAAMCRGVLRRIDIDTHVCASLEELKAELAQGAAALLIAEEALWQAGAQDLEAIVGEQPRWSDIPVLLLARHGADSPTILRALETLGNVTILERPTRVSALMSAVRAGLRARSRQYELRSQLVEQEKAAALLEQSSESLRLAMDAGAMGAFDSDLRNRTISWSEAAYDILGLPRSSGARETAAMWQRGIAAEDAVQVAAEYDRAKREGNRYALEYRYVRPEDGRTIWLSTLGRFTYGSDGEAVRSIGVFFDLTLRKQIEQQQRDLNSTLSKLVEDRTAQLRDLSQHLLDVSETEKTHLARELHDELGSLLTAISMDLAGLKRQLGTADPSLANQLEQTMELVQSTTQIKRRIMEGLHPSSLDSMGLGEALRALCSDFSARSSIRCELKATGDFGGLDESAAIALYRIVQEALTNAAKHSHAKAVDVHLTQTGAELALRITDDGSGFDTACIQRTRTHGVSGMRERVAFLDGRFGLDSSELGTVITVEIPIRGNTGLRAGVSGTRVASPRSDAEAASIGADKPH